MSISSVTDSPLAAWAQQIQGMAQSQTAALTSTTGQTDPTQQAVQAHHHHDDGGTAPVQPDSTTQTATATAGTSLLNKIV